MFVTAQHSCFNPFSCVLKERMKLNPIKLKSTMFVARPYLDFFKTSTEKS